MLKDDLKIVEVCLPFQNDIEVPFFLKKEEENLGTARGINKNSIVIQNFSSGQTHCGYWRWCTLMSH